MRRRSYVHKVDIAYTIIYNAVDVECEEHDSKKEFKTVGVVGKLNLEFLSDCEVEREYYNSDMIEEILSCNYPCVTSGLGSDKDCGNTADKTAGIHKAEYKSLELLILRNVDNESEDDLYRAEVEGKVCFRQHATVCSLVLVYVVEYLYDFGYNTDIEQNFAQFFKAEFS